ncbi:LOW QUALITY PROTEIN: LRAT domain-containing protein, partial [Cephalotus follicularis]
VDKKDLQPGDHIFAKRALALYSHHGIYVGDKQVIHFNTPEEVIATIANENPTLRLIPCGMCGYIRGSPGIGIMKTCIDHYGKKLYLYKYGVSWPKVLKSHGTCCPYQSKPLQEAVKTANERLNGFGKCNLLASNCKHFATFCSTGTTFSGQ